MWFIISLLDKKLEPVLNKGTSVVFLGEYKNAKSGYVVCQVSHNQMFSDKIEAISWNGLIKKLHDW